MIRRAGDTRDLLGRVAAGVDSSANLIDGAVFATQIGGRECFFETDALAVGSGEVLSVAEIKSFPLVDGRADEEKVAAALDQAALYVMLASDTLHDLGLPPERVNRNVHLILPKNVGLQPALVQRNVASREQRARELVRRAPTIRDVFPQVPVGWSFDPDPDGPQVDWADVDAGERIDALETMIEAVGTQYRPAACLSHCGFARICRLQATAAGDVELIGGTALRYMPGVSSLDRAAQLVDGAPALEIEARAAEALSPRRCSHRLRRSRGDDMSLQRTALAARAHARGRAQMATLYRHRHLEDAPMMVVPYHRAGESFELAAVAFGTQREKMNLVAVGQPSNRDLMFEGFRRLADWFVALYEAPAAETPVGYRSRQAAVRAPQVVVPNRSAAKVLGQWGRRLAYINTAEGPDWLGQVVLLGRHLQLLDRQRLDVAQQRLVVLTELRRERWVTGQSDYEDQHLAAMNRWIIPRADETSVWSAAAAAERVELGPLLQPDSERELDDLIQDHDAARAADDPQAVAITEAAVREFWYGIAELAWGECWDSFEHELCAPIAESAEERWLYDRATYLADIAWVSAGRRRRARPGVRELALTRRRLEHRMAEMKANRAFDDPLAMVSSILDGHAFRGAVISVDRSHREMGRKRRVTRPLVEIQLDDGSRTAPGRAVVWAADPRIAGAIVDHRAAVDGRVMVTVKVDKGIQRVSAGAIQVGEQCTFTTLRPPEMRIPRMPDQIPATHQPQGNLDYFGNLEV